VGPVAVLLSAALAAPCAYPEEGTLPLRRAVSRVRLHPDIEGWSREMRDKGEVVQYAVLLDEPLWAQGRCYWTVEVRLGEQPVRKFFVTPEGTLKE
jgi:hypothetical protein